MVRIRLHYHQCVDVISPMERPNIYATENRKKNEIWE